MGAKLAPWPVAPAHTNFQRDDLFFMPGTTEQERERTESARMLGMLQGSVEGLRGAMQDFRADVERRHRENQETIERLMNNIRLESDRATTTATLRVTKLEERVDELQTAHNKNAGAVAATRHVQKWIIALVPITIGIVELVLKIFKV